MNRKAALRAARCLLLCLLVGVTAAGPLLAAEEKAKEQPRVEATAAPVASAAPNAAAVLLNPSVAVIDMNMMILPGTQKYLEDSIRQAAADGAKLLIVTLNTPGGILTTSQEMIQEIFKSPIPVVVYVWPSGSTATSAGVFITMAAHVAAMAPGTSIGAAHPVTGEGKDIEGDMRKKAENMTVAMVKSISEQRGRNLEWAEKAVTESSSLTEKEALEKRVVDLVADDIPDLLKKLKGRQVTVGPAQKIVLEDYSNLPLNRYEMHYKYKILNVMANPNIAALLWLGATTGLSLELYHPGAVLPGVVGVICLVLALLVSQIIPISQGGVLLIVVGAVMIGMEMFVTSGILGIGGIIAMIFGVIYLVDVSQAPGMRVAWEFMIPVVVLCGGLLMYALREVVGAYKQKKSTGNEGLLGVQGRALGGFPGEGRVFVDGEIWKAVLKEGEGGIEKDGCIEVVGVKDGLVLEVKKI